MSYKVQLIKEEIERQIELGKTKCQESQENNDQESYIAWSEHIATCGKLLLFIDSLPEESASEDLEEAAEEYGIRQGVELRPFATKFFKAGAKWQKEQMMKDAVEGQIYREYIGEDGISNAFGLEAYLNEQNPKHNKFHDGDKVKIIIINEGQQ